MADFASFQFEIDRGNTEYLDFAVTLNGVPQNIAGCAVYFTAKRRLTDADPGAIQKSTANGGIVLTNAALGVGYVRIDPADTTGLPQARTTLFADQKVIDPTGQIFTTEKGLLIVRPEATNAAS